MILSTPPVVLGLTVPPFCTEPVMVPNPLSVPPPMLICLAAASDPPASFVAPAVWL